MGVEASNVEASRATSARSISKGLLSYSAVFLIPLALRLIPELQHSYPLGVDTPGYMYVIQYGRLAGGYAQTNIFYNLLVLLGRTGVSAMEFFKGYPAVTFALTALLIAIYLKRGMGWSLRSLVIFSIAYSFVPALLRTSLDLQRQSFAVSLLALALVLTTFRWDWRTKALALSAVYVLIGLTHELVFAIAVAIQLWMVAKALAKGRLRRDDALPPLIVAVSVVAYAAIRPQFVLPFLRSLFVSGYQPLGVSLASGWERFDWWASMGLLSYGFVLPLAAMGRFYDDRLVPWLIASIVPYASFAVSYVSFNLPDRWLYLAAVPISVYAANFLRRFTLRELSLYALLAIVAIQPMSMLGAMPLPLSVYAEKRYGTFADLMSTSVPEGQIRALQLYSERANRSSAGLLILVVPYELAPWATYFFPDDRVVPSDSPVLNSSSTTVVYVSYEGSAPQGFEMEFSYGGLSFYGRG